MEPAHVCLNGSLADLAIQDVLQILSLGCKTGHLSLETPVGAGALVFRQGRVVASIEKGGPLRASRVASLSGSEPDALAREQITAFVQRLARCRRGEFSFRASAVQGGGAPRPGIDVVDLLIDIAWRLEDEDRGETRPGAEARSRVVA